MHIKVCLSGLAVFAAAPSVLARFLAGLPQETPPAHAMLEERQATVTQQPTASTLSPDPWECITENITQYFDPPKPSGSVLSEINSYGDKIIEPCMATATGLDQFYCTVSDPQSWCGFSTAAPQAVMSSYLAFVSQAVSFYTEKSSKMSILSTSCASAWARFDPAEREWVKIATAHASCYLANHSNAGSTTAVATASSNATSSSSTSTSSKAPATTNGAVARGLEAFAIVSTGLAVFVNAA
ncbi:uncharacterized protein E0L32_004142 [Thyridium curvatum]|uniref:DUF7735 domain-containing protein n=1 Tax=Thyridium curvatum TaxID=1093900 RepID=A0A507B8I6_9PEZI|nr:uncharacterized protein E0L32_004142 [Thyridium curvatum]TPX16147.1 hypothetical protein E0L32_004142 [Thyridium curvatum]